LRHDSGCTALSHGAILLLLGSFRRGALLLGLLSTLFP
jgi:hypothetical protein